MPLELEADEQHPDRERRAEHTEDDARCHQIGASESVHDQPQGHRRRSARRSARQRDRHQLDAERPVGSVPGSRARPRQRTSSPAAPSMISARRRSTGSSTTTRRWIETTTKSSPSKAALPPTNATPKSCQASGSYAASISGVYEGRGPEPIEQGWVVFTFPLPPGWAGDSHRLGSYVAAAGVLTWVRVRSAQPRGSGTWPGREVSVRPRSDVAAKLVAAFPRVVTRVP